jgi:hypothetical protein
VLNTGAKIGVLDNWLRFIQPLQMSSGFMVGQTGDLLETTCFQWNSSVFLELAQSNICLADRRLRPDCEVIWVRVFVCSKLRPVSEEV